MVYLFYGVVQIVFLDKAERLTELLSQHGFDPENVVKMQPKYG
jgi:hypothetical protein